MNKINPGSGDEILAARFINDIARNPDGFTDEEIAKANLDSLVADYSSQDDLPNETADASMRSQESNVQDIQKQLEAMGVQSKPIDLSDPGSITEYLDKYVEGQGALKVKMSNAIADYMESGRRKGLLSIGPSGSGKTYSWEVIADAMGIPFVDISMGSVSAPSYKGANLSELIGKLEGVEKGILFLDEIDKIAIGADGSDSGDAKAVQLQNDLLGYFTGKKIKIEGASPQPNNNPPPSRGKVKAYGPSQGYFSRGSAGEEIKNKLVNRIDRLRKIVKDNNFEFEYVACDSGSGMPNDVRKYFKENDPNRTLENFGSQLRGAMSRSSVGNPDFNELFAVEFDKDIVTAPSDEELTKLLQEGDESKKSDTPEGYIDMSKILVVCAGAFHEKANGVSLYSIIQKRLGGSRCKLDKTKLLEQMTDQDLIDYGIRKEIVGRLPIRATLEPTGVDTLYRILKYKENSVLDEVKKQFAEYGITICFDDPTILYLAEQAAEGIGVRGLEKVLSSALEDLSFNRKKLAGRTLNISVNDIREKIEKEVKFEQVDEYEIDWNDYHSVKGYLDLFVPGQEEAKEKVAMAFHRYHVKMNNPDRNMRTSNLLLGGPTGAGKTWMVSLLANKAGLPMTGANMIQVTAQDYVGKKKFLDTYSVFSKEQKYGVVFLDEIDKVILNDSDPLNDELILALGKEEVNGRNTEHYLHILAGAFQKVYEREGKLSKEILKRYGVRPEILGRVPIMGIISEPNLESMVAVLKGPKSEIIGHKDYFDLLEIELQVEDGAIEQIAQYALDQGIGFRGIETACGELFDHYAMNQKNYVDKDTKILKVTTKDAKRILFDA
ncbi:MAG: AAA family ATPase [Nanoarchaeota archaeon]|nr:AAA family ATPase [Nanoarchaeota archaeon]